MWINETKMILILATIVIGFQWFCLNAPCHLIDFYISIFCVIAHILVFILVAHKQPINNTTSRVYKKIHKLLTWSICSGILVSSIQQIIFYLFYLSILFKIWNIFGNRCPFKKFYDVSYPQVSEKTKDLTKVLFLIQMMKLIFVMSY